VLCKKTSAITITVAVLTAFQCARAGMASAQEAPRRVTLQEALELFGRQNLELRIARNEVEEAEGLARQAAAFPNPALIASHEPLSGGGKSYSESYINVSQRLEWPATRSARRESSARTAAAARARLTADSVRLAFEVKTAYVEAGRTEHAVAVLNRVTAIFRETERRASDRLGEGDISEYDFRRIRVERARYETQLAEAELDAASARRTLALFVAPASEDLELAPAAPITGDPPPIDIEATLATAVSRRHEILAAAAELDGARAAAAVSHRERIPDVTATGGYKRQSDGLAGAYLGLSLPLPLWDRRGGAVQAADARVAAAEYRLGLIQRQVENDVRRAVVAFGSITRRAALLAEPLTEEAADLVEIAQIAYEEGEMDLIDVLDAADALREARIAEARLRADLWISYYDLERAVGGFDGSMDESEDAR
jgi:cobalt-zinc-cadmium efflux system outer membrane protein